MEKLTATFKTAYSSSRYGFNHECTVTTSEGRTAHVVCHYINRTWEAYPYQTAKKNAVWKLIQDEVEEDCINYKKTHRCNNRLPRGYRKECEKIYTAKYQDIYNSLSSCY